MGIYNNIDPDKFHQNQDEKTDPEFLKMMEKSFLSYFSYCLSQAGYYEVPKKALKEILDAHVKYGDIQLEANAEDYEYMRFWIYGLTEIYYEFELWHPSQRYVKSNGNFEEYEEKYHPPEKNKRFAHKHVIVASRRKDATAMNLKGYKDIPLGYFETLLPDAK